MVLVDTNIFIEIYRGKSQFIEILNTIGNAHILVSHFTQAELYFGASNSSELKTIEKDLDQFQPIPISNEISALAVDLINKYSLSHNLTLPDALIAATTLTLNAQLYSLNLKDFRFIPDLQLFEYLEQ
jgi:predicted nucleic acid-binding protein